MTTDDEHWEALERTLNETEVLRAIYGSEDDESSASFSIVAPQQFELNKLRRALGMDEADENNDDDNDHDNRPQSVPELQIEIRTHIDSEDENRVTVVLGFRLPRGYPEAFRAFVTSLRVQPPLHRSSIDDVTRSLNARAKTLLGTEAIMDLVEEAKNLCLEKHLDRINEQQTLEQPEENNEIVQPQTFGRRWIWVHHITKSDRITSILQEAQDLKLRGILKHGYPGVVLVEGLSHNCDAFVKWIKADKSSPIGGFGRNWGHHVRGEINYESENSSNLESEIKSTDDLAIMAQHCREAGLEEEFREYVLQHK